MTGALGGAALDFIGDNIIGDAGQTFFVVSRATAHWAVFGKGHGGQYLIADGYGENHNEAVALATRVMRAVPGGGLKIVN
jgi:hypothetical protein